MRRILSLMLPSAIVLLLFQSCTHDPYYITDPTVIVSKNCSPDTVYFVNEVLPVLQSNCATAGCHDALTAEEGVLMTDYVNIVQTGDVKPGKPKSSK